MNVSDIDPKTVWLNRVFAGLAFVISLIFYMKTVAPTFSFWDCGEFVACSKILGIAHPPGSPLYLIIGRLFSVLPIGDDVGWRINMLSCLSFSFATMIGFLIVRRAGETLWGGVHSLSERLTINFGSLSGALLLAFGLTAWASAVEAEVYGLAMAIYFSIIWLVMASYQAENSGARTRIALLALYLMVLGIGVHMTVALAAVIVIPMFALKEARQSDWIALTIFALVELYLIFALSSKPDEIALTIPMALILLGLLFHIFSLLKTPRALIITAGLLSLCCYPLIFDVWQIVIGAELPESITGVASLPIGWLGILASLVWMGFLGYKLMGKLQAVGKARLFSDEDSSGYLTSFLYLLCVLFLGIMTEYVRGYSAFLIITAILGTGVLAAIRSRVNWMLALAALSASGMILGFWEFVHGTFMIVPVITAFEYLRQRKEQGQLSSKLIIGVVSVFVAAAWTLRYSEVLKSDPLSSMAALGAIAIVCILWITQSKEINSRLSSHWKTAVGIVVLAVIGFSTQMTIPVRSAQSPMIDQNDPSRSVAAFVGFIERKQYGRTSMTERMFNRRAEWLNQLGAHRRMGFWSFFREQFGESNWRFPALFVMGVFGLWELFRRNKALGGVLFISLLAGTIGLVLYMNFADGSRMIGGADYLEVRDRDYFFTPGFMIFGLVIGLGVIAVLRLAQDFINATSNKLSFVLPMFAALSVGLPSLAIANNYSIEDRSGNYIPYDYAKNLLDSAEEGAILITGGDNDTFPLWALQSAYGYRLDVTVMNLSLSNTDWYLKQMRDKWGVPLPLTNKQIEGLRYRRMQDGRLSRIQEQVVDILLLTADKHKRPINFAKTIPPSGRKLQGQSIDNRLTARGRVYVVRPDTGGFVLALGATDSLYSNVFSFRGLGRDGVYQDAVSRGMTNSYANDFFELARIYRNRGAWSDVERILRKAVDVFPQIQRLNEEFIEALYEGGKYGDLKEFVDSAAFDDKRALYKRWTHVARGAGDSANAVAVLERAVEEFPDDRELFYGLAALQLEYKDYVNLLIQLKKWTNANPSDTSALGLLNRLQGATQGNN